jgi:hypothetical protein
MFAARKSVFVDLLKWDVPVLAGRYEVDQFDDPNAQYLILADRDGAHLASARLLPTLHPHILAAFTNACASTYRHKDRIFSRLPASALIAGFAPASGARRATASSAPLSTMGLPRICANMSRSPN